MSENIPEVTGSNRDDNGRFKSGVSGNPNGRPKNVNSIPDAIRKIANEDNSDGYTKLDSILYRVFDEALNGTRWAVEFIADRLEGRPFQAEKVIAEELPTGFDNQVIKSREQEEFEEYRDEFLEWKEGKD